MTMAKILKLNAISPVADKVIPSSYAYSDSEKDPEGRHEYQKVIK